MVATRRAPAGEAVEEPQLDQSQETAGRSIRQIVWARVRRDRVAMVCFFLLVFVYLVAIIGPFVAPLFGFDPYKFDRASISNLGGAPVLPWGGISAQHPLGVEWGTGRDIFSQLLWGLRISLLVATTATILTVTFGTVIGIIAGY